jgi:hypothetical protein
MSSKTTTEALEESIHTLSTPELIELIKIISDEIQIRLMQDAR